MNRFLQICLRALPPGYRQEQGLEIAELADDRATSPAIASVEGLALLRAGAVLRARNNLEMSGLDNLKWGVALASGFVVGIGILARSFAPLLWQVRSESDPQLVWAFQNGTIPNPWLSGVAVALVILVCFAIRSPLKASGIALAATFTSAMANVTSSWGFVEAMAYETRWLLFALVVLIAVGSGADNRHVFAFAAGSVFSTLSLLFLTSPLAGLAEGGNYGYSIDLLLERSHQPDWFGWACLLAAIAIPTLFSRCFICAVLVLCSSLPGGGAVRDMGSLATAISVVALAAIVDTLRSRVIANRLQLT